MKKKYITPAMTFAVNEMESLCIGIVGSTPATSGNLAKEREDEEEEEEEQAAFLAAEEEREHNGLW